MTRRPLCVCVCVCVCVSVCVCVCGPTARRLFDFPQGHNVSPPHEQNTQKIQSCCVGTVSCCAVCVYIYIYISEKDGDTDNIRHSAEETNQRITIFNLPLHCGYIYI